MTVSPHSALTDAWIDGAVHSAHPDYVAVLVVAAGLEPGPTSRASEAALLEAEAFAIARLDGREPHDLPEVLAWRQAYQGFGVKPREARSSVEARLVVAAGDESFDTVADGLPTSQTVAAGEIAWRDDAGVTCRRWNWRQCVRTRLTESTTDALFIIDGLGSDARSRAQATADDLVVRLRTDSPGASFAIRTLAAG